MFSPHGICLWEPQLIWLHVASDALIAMAYFSIPFALAIFVAKRRDLLFGWVYWALCIFTTACGLAHVLSICALWVPIFGIEGLVKATTAAASIVTAGALWLLLPKLLNIPSPFELRKVQAALEEEEIKSRDSQQVLEQFRETQRALRESMSRLTAVVETAVDGFILIDAKARILLFNPACERLFGYRAEEVMNKNVKLLMPPRIQFAPRRLRQQFPAHQRTKDHRHRPRGRRPPQGRVDLSDGFIGRRSQAGRRSRFS